MKSFFRVTRKHVYGIIVLSLATAFVLASVLSVSDKIGIFSPVQYQEEDSGAPIEPQNEILISSTERSIMPASITVVFDGSDFGLSTIYANDTFDVVSNALLEFADQGHSACMAMLRQVNGADDKSVVWDEYYPIETGGEFLNKIDDFADIKHSSDVSRKFVDPSYYQLIRGGIDLIKANAGNTGERLLFVVIGGDDKEDAGNSQMYNYILSALEESQTELYILALDPTVGGSIPLQASEHPYSRKIMKSVYACAPQDHVFKNISAGDIGLRIREIVEQKCYSDLYTLDVGTYPLSLEKPAEGRANSRVSLDFYTLGSCTYEIIWKRNDDGFSEDVIVASGDTEGFRTRVEFDLFKNIRKTEQTDLELSIVRKDAASSVYYSYAYNESDVYTTPIVTRTLDCFDYIKKFAGIDIRVILLVIAVGLLCATITCVLIRSRRAKQIEAKMSNYKPRDEKHSSRVIHIALKLNGNVVNKYVVVKDCDDTKDNNGWTDVMPLKEDDKKDDKKDDKEHLEPIYVTVFDNFVYYKKKINGTYEEIGKIEDLQHEVKKTTKNEPNNYNTIAGVIESVY